MTHLLRLVVLLLGVVVVSPAFAQTNDAAARALFDEGRTLMDEKKFPQACAKFEASQKIGPKASTALNLGVCYDKIQKFATAWSTFGTAATLAKREGHAEREKYAREQMAAMEEKLAKLTIHVGNSVAGLQVMLDDKPVIEAMYGTALPIDPGPHKLSATAPGKKPWSKEIVVPAEKASLTETIPMLEDSEAVTPTPIPTPTPTPAQETTPQPPVQPPPPPARSGTSPLVYIGFSLGGAGVVIGTITGIVAIANTSSIKDNCSDDDLCPSTERENIDDAELVANVSNVAFAAGAVGVVVGVIGLFVGGDDRPEQASIEPIVGPGYLGVSGRF